jgi:ribosomal subunit interface protein
MTVEIKGIHVTVTKSIQDYLDSKMPRLDFIKDSIVDFMLNISREKNLYKLDVTMNFRWGATKHVGVENFDLIKGVDDLFDTLEVVTEKEKSRIKDHKGRDKDQEAETAGE